MAAELDWALIVLYILLYALVLSAYSCWQFILYLLVKLASHTSNAQYCSFDFHCDAKVNSVDGSWLDANVIRSNRRYNSSSNSNSSSVSSISTSSSDSDYKTSGTGDLEADADSLMCRQSGLSSLDRSQNDNLKTVCFLYKLSSLYNLYLYELNALSFI